MKKTYLSSLSRVIVSVLFERCTATAWLKTKLGNPLAEPFEAL